jgi:hypothetical protein
MSYVKINDEDAYDAAIKLTKGCYQRALLRGEARLSGGDLRGKARKFGGAYARSRDNLLARLKEAGIKIGEETGFHQRRILVIG